MSIQKRIWFRLSIMVAVVMALLVVLQSAALAAPGAPPLLPAAPEALLVQAPRQILSGNLRVERGQVIQENVVVYSGDVKIDEGGVINGSLVVMSGNVEIDRGGNVEGDVTAYSGNIKIDGRVGGSVSALSGDIDLGDSARVEGDLSVLSGRVRRADGATVGGNLVQTPGLRIPTIPGVPAAPGQTLTMTAPRTSLVGQILGLMARLLSAVLLTGLVAAIAGVIFSVWPAQVARTRATLEAQRPLSFVVGLFGNLTLLFLIGLLSITICLLPLALVPMLALLAVNLVGWAVASQIVGERVVASLNQEVKPVLVVVVGAVVLTGIASLLWALGGCFRPIGFLFVLGVSSFGTGAVVVPWLNRQRGGPNTDATTTDADVQPPSPAPDATMEPSYAMLRGDQDAAVESDSPYLVGEQAHSDEVGQELGEAPAAGALAEDEFTLMRGVGPTIESKLKSAGLRTFVQLAAATPEEIAEILGWNVERVQRSELREQAQRLAEES